MPEILRITPGSIPTSLHETYRELIQVQYAPCLNGEDPEGIENSELFLFAAHKDDNPIGLIAGSFHKDLKTADLYSLSVAPSFRKQGIAGDLLKILTKTLSAAGAESISTLYPTDTSTATFLEKLLTAHNWSKPTLFAIRCLYDCYAFAPDWFQKQDTLPSQYSMFPWNELNEKERSEVAALVKQRGIPELINPLLHDECIEPLNSLGLRHQDQIIGWMITHRINPDTISYQNLYILPEYRGKGVPITMLAQSIRLQQSSPVQMSLFDVNTEHASPGWIRFIERRLAPYAERVTKLHRSFIQL